MGSVTRGGLEASRRGKERRKEHKSLDRPISGNQKMPANVSLARAPQAGCSACSACTSGNRMNTTPSRGKRQSCKHTPTLRIQANSRGPLRSQYRRPYSIPWLARPALYINGCIIQSVWDLSRRGQWHQWHPVLGRSSHGGQCKTDYHLVTSYGFSASLSAAAGIRAACSESDAVPESGEVHRSLPSSARPPNRRFRYTVPPIYPDFNRT